MEEKSEPKKDHENNSEQKKINVNSNINFITNNYGNEFIIKNNNDKTCQYCNKKFFSKFNKERQLIYAK